MALYQDLGADRPANSLTCYQCDGAGCGACKNKGYTTTNQKGDNK